VSLRADFRPPPATGGFLADYQPSAGVTWRV